MCQSHLLIHSPENHTVLSILLCLTSNLNCTRNIYLMQRQPMNTMAVYQGRQCIYLVRPGSISELSTLSR